MKRTLLRDCLRIAREKNESHPEKFKHYTFLFQDNKLLEWGINRSGNPLMERGYPEYGKIHAENDAYRKAKGLLDTERPWEAVNIRLSRSGALRLSLPCACCSAYLQALGCKTVWASTTNNGFLRVNL